MEAEVERQLNRMFATGVDDVALDDLYAAMRPDARVVAAGDGAVEAALEAMEAANKVMHTSPRS